MQKADFLMTRLIFQNQVDQKIADGIYALDERIHKMESAIGNDRARTKDLEKVG